MRAIVAPLVTMLVLAPVIVCNAVHSPTIRLVVVILAANLFVMLLSMLTNSKMIELAVAGATYVHILQFLSLFSFRLHTLDTGMMANKTFRYTTVLIVFISGPTI